MKKPYNTPNCEINKLSTQDIMTMSAVSELRSFDDGMDISSLAWE